MMMIGYVGMRNPLRFLKLRSRLNSLVKETGLVSDKIVYKKFVSLFFLYNPIYEKNKICMLFVHQTIFDQNIVMLEAYRNKLDFDFPIVMIVDRDTPENRQKYYKYNISYFIEENSTDNEFLSVSRVALQNIIGLYNINSQINQINLKNAQKVAQLNMLKMYVPVSLWSQIDNLAENQDFEIPENEKTLTILSLDIVGFTSKSERLSPKNSITLINDCFNIVEKQIYANNGDIDKFIGDAIVAIFNNAKDAIVTAVGIQNRLRDYNDSLLKKIRSFFVSIKEPIEVRIGIHRGEIIQGKVGGEKRYSSTIIGNTLTIADMLQSHCTNGDILISKDVFDSISGFDIDMPYMQYNIKDDVNILACQIYKYYKENKQLETELKKWSDK